MGVEESRVYLDRAGERFQGFFGPPLTAEDETKLVSRTRVLRREVYRLTVSLRGAGEIIASFQRLPTLQQSGSGRILRQAPARSAAEPGPRTPRRRQRARRPSSAFYQPVRSHLFELISSTGCSATAQEA